MKFYTYRFGTLRSTRSPQQVYFILMTTLPALQKWPLLSLQHGAQGTPASLGHRFREHWLQGVSVSAPKDDPDILMPFLQLQSRFLQRKVKSKSNLSSGIRGMLEAGWAAGAACSSRKWQVCLHILKLQGCRCDREVGFGSQVASSWAWRISNFALPGLWLPPFEGMITGQHTHSGLQQDRAPVVGMTSNKQSESEPQKQETGTEPLGKE